MLLTTDLLHRALSTDDDESRAVLAQLQVVDKFDLARETLAFSGRTGVPIAHLLAARGMLGRVDSKLLGGTLLDLRDPQGNTVLHYAAKAEQLQALPQDRFNAGHYYVRNQAGYAPIHLASVEDTALAIPVEVLSHPSVLTLPNPAGDTLLHALARDGALDLLHKGVVTQEMMSLPNQRGLTVAHQVAESSCSVHEAGHLLTDEVLRLRDETGLSVAALLDLNEPHFADPLNEQLAARVRAVVGPRPGDAALTKPPQRVSLSISAPPAPVHSETALRISSVPSLRPAPITPSAIKTPAVVESRLTPNR